MSGEGHPHAADRRARVPANVGQRFADDLRDDLAMLRRKHVLAADIRHLDADPVEARKLIALAPQLRREPVRAERRGPQLRQRVAHAAQGPLENLIHAAERFVRLAVGLFEIDLEQRDRPGEVGGNAVVQFTRNPRPLSRDRIRDRLLGE